jgi:hypothetical protein
MRTRFIAASVAVGVAAVISLTSVAAAALWNEDAAHPPHPVRPAAALVNEVTAIAGAHADTAPKWRFVERVQWAKWMKVIAIAHARQNASRGSGGCAPGDFACFRACTIERETHGTYGGVSSNGQYHGAWQFDQRTWDSNAAASGRTDLVGRPPEYASPADQDSIAYGTYQRRGKAPWGGRC